MSIHWKMTTAFPFSRVCVLGIILFFLGVASMVISIIAFVTESWGHYVGTGMWGGALILASGLTAVFVSRLKSLASVKTFLLCSVVGMFASLTMLILSAGGLTLTSGFYGRIDLRTYNKRTSNLIHASLLVIAVFCLSGNVLAIIVSSKYLFFDNHKKHGQRRGVRRNLIEGACQISLPGGAANHNQSRSHHRGSESQNSRRHSDNLESRRVPIEYRRSHRRTASDHANGTSHSRRSRSNHHVICNESVLCNALSSCSPRPQNGRRQFRSCVSGEERMNIVPVRQRSASNSHRSAPLQVRLARGNGNQSPSVRLPTEFNEEELPPYELAVQGQGASDSSSSPRESGDESDSANSSSSDTPSIGPSPLSEENPESVPMVNLRNINRKRSLQNQQLQNRQQFTDPQSALIPNSESVENNSQPVVTECVSVSSARSQLSPSTNVGSMVVRKDSKRSNRPILCYMNVPNSTTSSPQGDYERLRSVSPEVRALTGASPNLRVGDICAILPHTSNENFYENGPCYANVQNAINVDKINIENQSLPIKSSKQSSSSFQNNNVKKAKKASARKVPVHVISPKSNKSARTVISTSPVNKTFGSTRSAFRPVGITTTSLSSPHSAMPLGAEAISPVSPHKQIDVTTLCAIKPGQLSKHEAKDNTPGESEQKSLYEFKEQGAIPKYHRQKQNKHDGHHGERNKRLSWKSVPLPHSYNHSGSLCNDLATKLPEKTMPFSALRLMSANITGEDIRNQESVDIASIADAAQQTQSFIQSTKEPKASNVPFGLVAEAIISTSLTKSDGAIAKVETSSQTQETVSSSSLINNSNTSAQSQPFRPSSKKMGSHQIFLQSRRTELQHSPKPRRRPEMGTNTNRPRSMPSSSFSHVHSQHLRPSALSFEPANERRQGSSDQAEHNPLSLNSYLVHNAPNNGANGSDAQHPQPQFLRSNQLVQHYPLQPQQPRLGVQLQQRRQQQHQLQQNIESQQHQHNQQQQLPQQQQQPLQVHQQNPPPQQPSRNGRPLFSVLL